MRLLPKHISRVRVKLTSIDGETKTFRSIKAAAEFLNVTRMAIYQALDSEKARCRGCKL